MGLAILIPILQSQKKSDFFISTNKMFRLVIFALVILAVTANEMSVEEMMKEGMKVMKKEGLLGELQETGTAMSAVDLNQICTGACSGGSAAIGLLCKLVPGVWKIACYGVMFAGPAACNAFCKLLP